MVTTIASATRTRSGDVDGLLRDLAQGDLSAFESLYDVMAGRVFGLCRRVLRDESLAEEVAQEVLLTIWTDAARFDPARGSGIGWILTVTHRKAVDRVRSSESTRRRDDAFHAAVAEIDVDLTIETTLRSLAGEEVRAALGRLSTGQREALVLAYYDGLTHREVAEALDIPLGTAKTRIRDGLHALRCAGLVSTP